LNDAYDRIKDIIESISLVYEEKLQEEKERHGEDLRKENESYEEKLRKEKEHHEELRALWQQKIKDERRYNQLQLRQKVSEHGDRLKGAIHRSAPFSTLTLVPDRIHYSLKAVG
jgi:hypothetical protein